MTLVDTSVWVEHLRRGEPRLAALLDRGDVSCHPFVAGEIACGSLKRRAEVLSLLGALPQVEVADHREMLAFTASGRLAGRGLGWVDMHLLAAARLSDTALWTIDRRLDRAARDLGLAVP